MMLSQFSSFSLGYSAPPPTTPQPILSFCTNISQFKVNCTSEAACVAAVPNPIPPYANFTDPYHLCLDNTAPPGATNAIWVRVVIDQAPTACRTALLLRRRGEGNERGDDR